jgi:hypothetical protein
LGLKIEFIKALAMGSAAKLGGGHVFQPCDRTLFKKITNSLALAFKHVTHVIINKETNTFFIATLAQVDRGY